MRPARAIGPAGLFRRAGGGFVVIPARQDLPIGVVVADFNAAQLRIATPEAVVRSHPIWIESAPLDASHRTSPGRTHRGRPGLAWPHAGFFAASDVRARQFRPPAEADPCRVRARARNTRHRSRFRCRRRFRGHAGDVAGLPDGRRLTGARQVAGDQVARRDRPPAARHLPVGGRAGAAAGGCHGRHAPGRSHRPLPRRRRRPPRPDCPIRSRPPNM